MLNGKRHGYGVLISNIGDTYSGNFINGYLTGYGQVVTKKGNKY